MKKLGKIFITTALVLCGLSLFVIAPRIWGKADMSAFSGVRFAHRGYFDNESDAPENSLPSFEKPLKTAMALNWMYSCPVMGWPWFSTMLTLNE